MNEWSQDKNLVEFRLQSTDKKLDIIFSSLNELRDGIAEHNLHEQDERGKIWNAIASQQSAIAVLQVKAGVWGLVGGAIPVAVMLAMNYLKP